MASVAMLFVKFHAGAKTSHSDFWPHLLEKPVKFVLICHSILCRSKDTQI